MCEPHIRIFFFFASLSCTVVVHCIHRDRAWLIMSECTIRMCRICVIDVIDIAQSTPKTLPHRHGMMLGLIMPNKTKHRSKQGKKKKTNALVIIWEASAVYISCQWGKKNIYTTNQPPSKHNVIHFNSFGQKPRQKSLSVFVFFFFLFRSITFPP